MRQKYLSHEITHEEYYSSVVKMADISYTKDSHLVERAKQSTDKNLNDIPLYVWDSEAHGAKQAIKKALESHGDQYSLAGGVCVIKEAVREALK